MEDLRSKPIYGQLSVISMRGCEEMTEKIDWYLRQSEKITKTKKPTSHTSNARDLAPAKQSALSTKL